MANGTGAVRGGGRVTSSASANATATANLRGGAGIFGPYQTANTGNESARTQAWLPPVRVPVGYVMVGNQRLPVMIDDQWYRAMDEISNRRLGGINGPTVVDVATNVQNVAATTEQVAVSVTQANQTAAAAAQAINASRQVSIDAGLPGAENIPEVNQLVQ